MRRIALLIAVVLACAIPVSASVSLSLQGNTSSFVPSFNDSVNSSRIFATGGWPYALNEWPGRYNASVFDGASYISLNDTAGFPTGTTNFSVVLQFKRTGNFGAINRVFGAASPAAAGRQIELVINTDGSLSFSIFNTTGSGIDTQSSAKITDTNVHYIVFTKNLTRTALYIDGIADTSMPASNLSLQTPYQTFSIGKLGLYSGQYFNGTIYNFTIYKDTLVSDVSIPVTDTSRELITWNQLTPTGLPTSRTGGAGGVFNGKVWLIGGIDASGNYKNDTYYTTEMQTWTQAAATTAFTGRAYSGWGVLGSRMYLVDGGTTENPYGTQEIWSSLDGVTWVQNTTLPMLLGHSTAIATHKNVMYAAGGILNGSQVWSTVNGDTWVEKNSSAPFSIQGATLQSMGDYLYLIDGKKNDTYFPQNVWRSENGTFWDLISSNIRPGRYTSPTVVADNKLWILGGGIWVSTTSKETYFNDVWSSPDGIAWTQQNIGPQFSPRFRGIAVNYNSSIYLYSGKKANLQWVDDIYYTPLPIVAQFISSSNRTWYPSNIMFTDTSTGNPITWNWNFGDGDTSTLQNPTHSWSTPGMYLVTLTASNDGVYSINSTWVESGTNGFTMSNISGIAPHTIAFTNTTTAGNVSSRLWDFGDGSTSTAINPVHTYTNFGNFPVNFTVTNLGVSNSTHGNVTIYERLHASFTKTGNGVVPLTVNFHDTSNNATTWNWTMGDGNTSVLQNPSHVYRSVGNYIVTLNVTNSDGSFDVATGVVEAWSTWRMPNLGAMVMGSIIYIIPAIVSIIGLSLLLYAIRHMGEPGMTAVLLAGITAFISGVVIIIILVYVIYIVGGTVESLMNW